MLREVCYVAGAWVSGRSGTYRTKCSGNVWAAGPLEVTKLHRHVRPEGG